jgi:hypothetical protein
MGSHGICISGVIKCTLEIQNLVITDDARMLTLLAVQNTKVYSY